MSENERDSESEERLRVRVGVDRKREGLRVGEIAYDNKGPFKVSP